MPDRRESLLCPPLFKTPATDTTSTLYSVPAVSFLLTVKLSNVAVVSVTLVLVSFTVVPSFTVTVYDVTAPLEGAVQETVSEFTGPAVTWRSVGAFGSVQTHYIYGINENKPRSIN